MGSEVWSDEKIIDAIKKGGADRKSALSDLYRDQVIEQRIINLVIHRGGNKDEASEIFIESIILTDRNIRADKFRQESSLRTYIYAVAKFTWNNYVRAKRNRRKNVSYEYHEIPEQIEHQNPELLYLEDELKEKLKALLELLNEKCRTIIKLWSQGADYTEIAENLGVKAGGALRKQKLVCMRKLKEHLLANPDIIPKFYHGKI